MFGVGIWNLVFLSITYAKVKVRAAQPISIFAGVLSRIYKKLLPSFNAKRVGQCRLDYLFH